VDQKAGTVGIQKLEPSTEAEIEMKVSLRRRKDEVSGLKEFLRMMPSEEPRSIFRLLVTIIMGPTISLCVVSNRRDRTRCNNLCTRELSLRLNELTDEQRRDDSNTNGDPDYRVQPRH
jgi:hypothetical protein